MAEGSTVINQLKAIAYLSFLFLSSLFGVIVFGGFLLPVFFVRPVRYRQLFDYMMGIWLWMAAAGLEILIGVEVIVTGDMMRPNEPSIIIMNHRTRLDWLYFFCVLARQPSGIMTEKIILKAPLKYIPGPGWAMQVSCFMFINRRWEDDQRYLVEMLDYYRLINRAPQILIFPEGTDFTEKTRSTSDKYALKNGLKSYEHVLQPRTTGFGFLVDYARKHWPNAAVYDVTLAYRGSFPQGETDFLSGVLPESTRYHIRRYSIADDVPVECAQVDNWLRSRWDEKDDRIERISKGDDSNPSPRDGMSVVRPQSDFSDWIHVYYRLSLAFWLAFVIFSIVMLLSSCAIWLPTIAVCVFFFVIGSKFGGFELLQARYTKSRLAKFE